MKRSDLRVVAGLDLDAFEFHREVSDDDLRSMAPELLAVLLDGVDVKALRDWKSEMDRMGIHTGVPYRTVTAVLAALEGETT